MIKIYIPNNNIYERKYILDIIFNEFLGITFEVNIDDNISNWIIGLENGNKLIFEDHFFNKFPKDLEYLKLANIPSNIEFTNNKFIVEDNIPILYGNSKLNINNLELYCGIDMFASSFFMLTRWEEYINKNRDNHHRFPAYESLAFKYNFLDRPIVNEYLEMIKNMLQSLDNNLVFKNHHYKLFLTHDVDTPLKYINLKSGIKEIAGDIIKRKDIKLALSNILSKLKTTLKLESDPYNTFDYLMSISEENDVRSYFFFMGKGLTKFDNMYKSDDVFIEHLIKNIKQRGHYIGIHPTYNAYNQSEQFLLEKKELEKHFNTSITFGRGHYLRFEIPTTWQIWEDNGMKWDSTLGYADKEGFRCGVCYEYSVFNILTRKKLNLKEKPLIVMEGSFATYQPNVNPHDMENKIKYLMEKVKKFDGEFLFLWHNSSFNTTLWEKYQNIYKKVLK